MPGELRQGLLDTNVVILHAQIDPARLPEEVAICAVTLAELSAGVHLVAGDDAGARAERARRIELLQRVENRFDALPFDDDAARLFGRLSGAVRDAGRTPRRRTADLMIAAVAAAHRLPLITTNPADFVGLGELVEVVAIPRR